MLIQWMSFTGIVEDLNTLHLQHWYSLYPLNHWKQWREDGVEHETKSEAGMFHLLWHPLATWTWCWFYGCLLLEQLKTLREVLGIDWKMVLSLQFVSVLVPNRWKSLVSTSEMENWTKWEVEAKELLLQVKHYWKHFDISCLLHHVSLQFLELNWTKSSSK